MRKMKLISNVALFVITMLLTRPSIGRAEDVLKDKDTVAICGDSITEQKIYSMFMETYLLACKPKMDLRVDQFGWSGEQAVGFLARLQTDVLPLKPTLATTCYGMNDGHYTAMTDQTGDVYKKAMEGVVAAFKAGGVRTVVVGAPGCVDSEYFKRPTCTAEVYNDTLAKLGDIAREIAKQNNMPFADVHGEMITVMTAAKQKYGDKFVFAGADGVHPPQAGHLVMAYAFLKAMGCDGDIGTITLDFTGNTNTASDGHKILSAANNTAEIESTRYPFCFMGDGKSPNSERSVADLFPFNADLNRFTLVVKNLSGGDMKVTWGTVTKTFSAASLGKGINLAAEFEEANPFTQAITDVESAVALHQAFETTFSKSLLHGAPAIVKADPDAEPMVKEVNESAMKLDSMLLDAAIKKASMPIRHTIKIEPAQ